MLARLVAGDRPGFLTLFDAAATHHTDGAADADGQPARSPPRSRSG